MDYVLASGVHGRIPKRLVFSYDIACQYSVHLAKRMREWPDSLKFDHDVTINAVIPKLHARAHEEIGHEQYSLYYTPGVGTTDGEAAERLWAPHNVLGNSTKTQGPGSRNDVLDDHFGFWNWTKYHSMGTCFHTIRCNAYSRHHSGRSLMRRYKAAVPQRNQQIEAHRGFTESLSPQHVATWTDAVEEWENDESHPKKVPSPYEIKSSGKFSSNFRMTGILTVLMAGLSVAHVRKELADEEQDRLNKGGTVYHEVSASSFISIGLELQDLQYVTPTSYI
jgi:hypothetical protein